MLWHGSNTLLVSTSQMVDLQTVVEYGGFEVVLGAVVVVGGVVGVTQGIPGTCHPTAEAEQLSSWPFGKRQSLLWELSQVPHCPSVFPWKRR